MADVTRSAYCGLRQLGEMAAKDSILNTILRATDDALNATRCARLSR